MKITEFRKGDIIKLTDRRWAETPYLTDREFTFIECTTEKLSLKILVIDVYIDVYFTKYPIKGWEFIGINQRFMFEESDKYREMMKDYFNSPPLLSEPKLNPESGLFPQYFRKGMSKVLSNWDSVSSEQLNSDIDGLLDARLEYDKMNE